MRKRPFFSIVIPTYNRASDLEFALFCILRQTYRDFEIVISNNYSSDNTKEVVEKFHDRRIHYSRTKKILDNASNMKRALSLAKGEYIFFHSDDDFLIYANSLEEIYRKIKKYKPGYIRINYFSLSFDKKRVFSYKVRKPFQKDTFIPKDISNKKAVDFILDSDPYFITGIIVKNTVPKDVHMINSDPVPWFEVVFYNVKSHGGLFIHTQHVIANWSRRKIKKNARHHIFTLINGRLRAEGYFEAVKKKLSESDYQYFLHNELLLLYVTMFPMMKFNVGNKKMNVMSQRICRIDEQMRKDLRYWIYFLPSFIMPRFFFHTMRDMYLYAYTIFGRVDKNEEFIKELKKLQEKYQTTVFLQ